MERAVESERPFAVEVEGERETDSERERAEQS
jgi:hypothetical protein